MKKKYEPEILQIAMREVLKSSVVALPLIILFEGWMVFYNAFLQKTLTGFPHFFYLGCHLFLFLLSLCGFLLLLYYRKLALQITYTKIWHLQNAYITFLTVWTLVITIADIWIVKNNSFYIFVSIMTLVPLFCYMRPVLWDLFYLISSFILIHISYYMGESALISYYNNLAVFLIIFMIAHYQIYLARTAEYRRELDLLQLNKQETVIAKTDALTGLKNRRCFNEDMVELSEVGIPNNLVVATFDVNGLKKVNDTLGHEAGDELLQAAASMLKNIFGKYGSIYRVGGDEFYGILLITDWELELAVVDFENLSSFWKGNLASELSVSMGFCPHIDNPNKSITELFTLSDAMMYENKRRYYANNGRDRRHTP